MGSLSTSQLAKQAEINPETLRYYIRRELLEEPSRSSSGYRQYPEETIVRIRFIKSAQELGFTLQEIKELLAIRMDSKAACKTTAYTLHQKREDIEQKISRLQKILNALESMEAICARNKTRAGCPILELLDQEEKPW